MQELEGRTAVVTGAASGIGKALAERFAASGMNLVLADIEEGPLAEVASTLRDGGVKVLDVPTDVSKAADVDALAAAADEAFGPVHVLCNNAGVGGGGMIHDLKTEDWEWVINVNLWGVIHGLRAFLGGMYAHGEEGHVVNTASLAGLYSAPFMAPYSATKFAVVAISEALHQEALLAGGRIGVSVLCPGWVNTRIHESSRNRPAELGGDAERERGDSFEFMAQILAAGMPPATVAEHVERAIRERRFYVITHPEMLGAVEERMRNIVEGRTPEQMQFSAGLFGGGGAR